MYSRFRRRGGEHIHTFSEEWTSDKDNHWHTATCEHTAEISGKAAHTFGEWKTTLEPTATEDGKKERTCSVCKYKDEQSIANLSHTHTFAEAWTSDAEYHWHAATCEHTAEISGKAAHTFGEWTVTKPAVGTEDGTRERICSVCGYKATESYSGTGDAGQDGSQYLIIEDNVVVDCSESATGTITIPGTVTSIRNYAFRGCTRLESVKIPESVKSIGNVAFHGCTNLTDISIPAGITSIGESVFYNCDNLKTISFGGTLNDWLKVSSTSAANVVFGDGTAMSSITEITENDFDGITKVNDYVLSNCKSIEKVSIPDGIVSIGGNSFMSCEKLTALTIPASVKTIGYMAFSYCESLGNVVLPDGVETITVMAFFDCTKLESISIPKSVTSIGSNALYGNRNLKIIYAGTLNDWLKLSVEDVSAENATFNGTAMSSITEIKASDFDNVTKIENQAFSGCSSLTSVTIPEGVTSIGQRAFSGCNNLETIAIPKSIANIGADVFYNSAYDPVHTIVYAGTLNDWLKLSVKNVSAKEVTFNGTAMSSITEIKAEVFDGVTNIAEDAFYECTSLSSVEIPEGVTSIGSHAFMKCTSLTSITIPASLTKIGIQAFESCEKLTDITYSGTTEQFNAISIGSPSGLSGKTITCSDSTITME